MNFIFDDFFDDIFDVFLLIYQRNLISKVHKRHDISPFERNDFHMQNRNVIVLSSLPFRKNILSKKGKILNATP